MLDEYSTVSVVVIDTVVNALLYILSGLFIIKGEFTIGGAFAFITYSAYVVNPISALINIKYYFAQIEPSAKRLFELWGQPEELEMKLCEMKPEKIYQDRDMVFEVKNLVFGYEPGHPILNGISLCVKKRGTNCDRRRKWKWQINTFEPFGGILPATKRNNKIVWSSCGIDGYTRYEK